MTAQKVPYRAPLCLKILAGALTQVCPAFADSVNSDQFASEETN